MCNKKREEIIVQAAGTGTNNSAQQYGNSFKVTEWLLLAIVILIVIFLITRIIKKMKRDNRAAIREEIRMHAARSVADNINQLV